MGYMVTKNRVFRRVLRDIYPKAPLPVDLRARFKQMPWQPSQLCLTATAEASSDVITAATADLAATRTLDNVHYIKVGVLRVAHVCRCPRDVAVRNDLA